MNLGKMTISLTWRRSLAEMQPSVLTAAGLEAARDDPHPPQSQPLQASP